MQKDIGASMGLCPMPATVAGDSDYTTRRTFMKAAISAMGASCLFFPRTAACGESNRSEMGALEAIRTRRSVRVFTKEDVTDQEVEELLRAAMCAPSAGNEQPWEFIVIRDKKILEQVASINRHASYAKDAPVCILVCGNKDYDKFARNGQDGYWLEDVSAATQNLLLAAHAMGLGAVWTGIYPFADRTEGFRNLVCAPENIIPMAFVVIGHPGMQPKASDRFQRSRIHKEKWGTAS